MKKSRLFSCKKVFLLFLASALCILSYAQDKSISGIVKSNSGTPLGGVTVIVQNSNIHSLTKDDGTYTIKAEVGAHLIFSYIGYQTQTITASSATLDVILVQNDSASAGNDVVVTALGIKRESRAIGYSAQQISGADITKAAAPDLASGLMGKSAGLNITTSNGVQGNSSRIVIRGNNSILGSNQPLLVIDGIQVSNDPVGGQQSNLNASSNGSVSSSTSLENPKDWGSYINFINNDDIADVTVLKGATAAALYGARGANGVLLMTTKKGTKYKKGLGINYNFSTYFSDPYRFQSVQNEYGYGLANSLWTHDAAFPTTSDGQLRYPGNYPWDGTPAGNQYEQAGPIPGGYQSYDIFSWYGPAASWGHKLDGTEIIWWDGVKRKWDPQPDNRKAFFRTGNTSTHNVSLEGGGDFGTIRFSYTRMDNTAIVKNSNYNSNNFNLGSTINLAKRLKAEVSASYLNYNRLNAPDIGGDQGWSNFMIYSMSRDYKPIEFNMYKNPDGSRADLVANSGFGYYPYQNNYNNLLFWHLSEQNQRLNRNQLVGSIKLSADIFDWLNITGRTSLNTANTQVEAKYAPIDASGLRGQYGLDLTKNNDVNFEVFTTLHKDHLFITKLNGSIMVGNSAIRSRMHDIYSINNGETTPWVVPFKYYLANTSGSIPAPTETWSNYNINSIFSILNLSYDNYLFLEVTGRNDWSSTLPVATSSYFYPSASLSYVFTDGIKSLRNLSWLSYGKLKLSAAKSANGASPYLSTYTYNTSVISNYINGTAPQSFGGQPVISYYQTLPPASLLVPQRNSSYEIGLEAGFLKSKINFEFTYYQTKSTSQILSSNLAGSTGASSITFNTGELSNKGIELIIRANAIRTNNFSWDITLNAAHNANKVISLAAGIPQYPLQDLWGTNGVQMYVKAGQEYGTIYGYDYTYLNGKKVVKKVLDQSDPSKVVGTQYVTTESPVSIGNATPKFTGGLSNTFRYKNISLYFLTDFRIGGQIWSADYAAAMGEGLSPRTLKERNGGGLPYTYPDGSTTNTGVILDGVFADGTPNTDVVNYIYKYAGQYGAWSNVPMPRSNSIFTNSWAKLRELTFTYSFSDKFISKVKFIQGLDVSLVGRNLFYLFTKLPDHLNPEAINGIGNGQGIQWSEMPGTRDFGFSLKVKF